GGGELAGLRHGDAGTGRRGELVAVALLAKHSDFVASQVASYDLDQTRGHGRYFLLVFRQQAAAMLGDAQVEAATIACKRRSDFNLGEWAESLGLGSAPMAVNWFRTNCAAHSAVFDGHGGLSISISHSFDSVPHPPLSPIIEDA